VFEIMHTGNQKSVEYNILNMCYEAFVFVGPLSSNANIMIFFHDL
jgi:hypothetical protein